MTAAGARVDNLARWAECTGADVALRTLSPLSRSTFESDALTAHRFAVLAGAWGARTQDTAEPGTR